MATKKQTAIEKKFARIGGKRIAEEMEKHPQMGNPKTKNKQKKK